MLFAQAGEGRIPPSPLPSTDSAFAYKGYSDMLHSVKSC